jgi:hypothetical protein
VAAGSTVAGAARRAQRHVCGARGPVPGPPLAPARPPTAFGFRAPRAMAAPPPRPSPRLADMRWSGPGRRRRSPAGCSGGALGPSRTWRHSGSRECECRPSRPARDGHAADQPAGACQCAGSCALGARVLLPCGAKQRQPAVALLRDRPLASESRVWADVASLCAAVFRHSDVHVLSSWARLPAGGATSPSSYGRYGPDRCTRSSDTSTAGPSSLLPRLHRDGTRCRAADVSLSLSLDLAGLCGVLAHQRLAARFGRGKSAHEHLQHASTVHVCVRACACAMCVRVHASARACVRACIYVLAWVGTSVDAWARMHVHAQV